LGEGEGREWSIEKPPGPPDQGEISIVVTFTGPTGFAAHERHGLKGTRGPAGWSVIRSTSWVLTAVENGNAGHSKMVSLGGIDLT
jgi:hypothetical protein